MAKVVTEVGKRGGTLSAGVTAVGTFGTESAGDTALGAVGSTVGTAVAGVGRERERCLWRRGTVGVY